MALSKKDFKKAQDLLDAGKTLYAVSVELGVCNKTIKRHVDNGNLQMHEDIVFPFEQELDTPYGWLEFEDILERVCDEAFTEMRAKFPGVITRKSLLSEYIIENYGSLRGYFENKDMTHLMDLIFINCGRCGKDKVLSDWHLKKGNNFGLSSECGVCTYKRVKKSYFFRVNNEPGYRRKLNNYQESYARENPDKVLANYHNRLARKKSLPDMLTGDVKSDIFNYFGNSCALTGDVASLHIEHTITLSVGHGGTLLGNIIPMRSDLNLSKNDRNIFEWFEDNRKRLNICQRRFDEMITYLSRINDVTEKEYREFVYWCHDNPRTIEHTEIDNERYGYKKPSIDIWKEYKEAVV